MQEEQQDDPKAAAKAVAKDILSAIEAKDESMLAAALESAFQIFDSQPHEEGDHTNEDEGASE